MKTYYIPNTSVEAEVIDPPSGSDYVSLFLSNEEKGNSKKIGSVNAGTSNDGFVFAVGLGGINGGFKRALQKAGQSVDDYQQIHQSLYDKSGSNISDFQTGFTAADPVQFSLIQKPNPSFKLPKYDGIVFIDIFNSNQLPNSNSLNYSMIYLVPPESSNYNDEAGFMRAIEASNITIIDAIHNYNTNHANDGNSIGLEAIENIRMCLFSGGYYRGSSTEDDVALNNLAGLESGLKNTEANTSLISKVVFENSYDSSTKQHVFRVIQGKLDSK